MNRYLMLAVAIIGGISIACLCAVTMGAMLYGLGDVTDSGLGSCGPYGPLGVPIIMAALCSIPASIGAGVYSGWGIYRHYIKTKA
jgi:hypothetical protein